MVPSPVSLFESGVILDPGHQLTETRPRWWLLYAVITLVGAILIGRSFYLQVITGSHLRATAEGNRVTAVPIPAPRGIIYDTNGHQLVENIASTDVVLNPIKLPTPDNESILIERLPDLLPIKPDAIQTALTAARSTQRTVRLAAAVDHEAVISLEQEAPTLPGVELVSTLVRRYVDGATTAPFMGYTSLVTADELATDQSLRPTDITGKTGIEQVYDQDLRGTPGVVYEEVNAVGQLQKQIEATPATPGADLHLSLDLELQQFITHLLADRNVGAGSVIALDPRSGAIRALVSYPSYDANVFSQPSLRDQTAATIADDRNVLFNRAVNGMYPPGSTIKPFLAAAALKEHIITPETTFLSTGGLHVGVWTFPDWKAGGHGITDVKKALAESVNTFFYLITGGNESVNGLGITRATSYLAEFGWGKTTGIDIPNEATGFLPTPEWKESVKNEPWYIGDTYHLAIGQGDVLATPLQVAVSTAAIANGGTLVQPFLVRSVALVNQEQQEHVSTAHRLNFPSTDINTIQAGMRQAVTTGSGQSLNTMSINLAGKTGTAQIGGTDETHAWFTSFGPYEHPELVLTILVERGGDGDKVAVPLAKEMWQWWIDNRIAQNN